jgi:hypothetical protein
VQQPVTERPLRRRKGVAALAAAALALAVLIAGVLVVRQARQAELDGLLAARVTGLLEGAGPAEHHEHGHEFGHEPGRVVCAVDPFGVEPAGAATVAEVEWVYAHHMCAITGPGAGWAMSVRASGPIAVQLSVPPVVRVPRPGAGYPERVRELIPVRYHEQALGEFGDEGAIEEARRRFERESGR